MASAFRRERPLLDREMHRLAVAYRWSLDDILSLPRTQRRSLVSLAEAEWQAGAAEAW
jgi:hypothetical protein